MLQRNILLLVFDVEQHRVALVESAATSILSAESDRHASFDQASQRQRFRHAVIHRAFAGSHLGALLEQLLDLGMDVEALRDKS